jgi:AraC family transcriptional regulator, transcriptional activator of pobA
MDRGCILLDYPNMKTIPSYALYGEPDASREQDWLHWESIQSRSRLHDYRIAPHRHQQFFQVLHLTGGWARVTMDGMAFDLVAPAVIVVPALTVHGYVFDADVEGIVLTLMERDVRAAGLGEPEAAVLRGTDEVGEAIDRLIAEADRPAAGHSVAMRALIALLLVAIRRARQEPAPGGTAGDRSLKHAQAFRWLVDKQFRQTRTIADYAGAMGISPTHLNRVSRQVLGASALQVIERRIALEARRQLLFSTLSIKEIGAELGYDDPAYFTRFLSRALGMAPAQYRRQAREAEGG